eukprot:4537475-Alexandrium_andersonii.AAC.1
MPGGVLLVAQAARLRRRRVGHCVRCSNREVEVVRGDVDVLPHDAFGREAVTEMQPRSCKRSRAAWR